MFKRENIKWTIPAMVLVAACLGAALYLTVGASVATGDPPEPPPLTADAVVAAMQARAGSIGGLSGILGEQVKAPEQGDWKGVPFTFRGDGSYVRQDGSAIASPEATPQQTDNAWTIFKDGRYSVRPVRKQVTAAKEAGGATITLSERGRTVQVDVGQAVRGRVYGCDEEALLLANLMPGEWFGATMDDITLGADEVVDGVTYHVLLDVKEPLEGSKQLVRWPKLWKERTPRKYYVNAANGICERVVFGSPDEEDPFANPVRDVVAGDVQSVGGALLPTTYTFRFYGPSGVHFSSEMKLQSLEAQSAESIADAAFDAEALTPKGIVTRPSEDLDELAEYMVQHAEDAGGWLTLMDMYLTTGQVYKAKDAYDAAMEAIGEEWDDDFYAERERLWHDLNWHLVRRELNDAPQMEAIFARREARMRAKGDAHRADEWAARSDHYRQVKEAAVVKARDLGISTAGVN